MAAGTLIAERCGLTNRETEVMLLVSRGNSKNKIADMLFVSSGTIQTHTKSIYRKLDFAFSTGADRSCFTRNRKRISNG